MLWVLIRIASPILMSTHNICFWGKIPNISKYYLKLFVIWRKKIFDRCFDWTIIKTVYKVKIGRKIVAMTYKRYDVTRLSVQFRRIICPKETDLCGITVARLGVYFGLFDWKLTPIKAENWHVKRVFFSNIVNSFTSHPFIKIGPKLKCFQNEIELKDVKQNYVNKISKKFHRWQNHKTKIWNFVFPNTIGVWDSMVLYSTANLRDLLEQDFRIAKHAATSASLPICIFTENASDSFINVWGISILYSIANLRDRWSRLNYFRMAKMLLPLSLPQ